MMRLCDRKPRVPYCRQHQLISRWLRHPCPICNAQTHFHEEHVFSAKRHGPQVLHCTRCHRRLLLVASLAGKQVRLMADDCGVPAPQGVLDPKVIGGSSHA